jgi:BolA family transcriptional regulator, general stress-responsive regulator
MRLEKIREKLTAALEPTELEVIDDSAAHRGHAGAAGGAGHYTVKIASPLFTGRSKVQNHRLIYEALDGMIPDDIHALKIEIIS